MSRSSSALAATYLVLQCDGSMVAIKKPTKSVSFQVRLTVMWPLSPATNHFAAIRSKDMINIAISHFPEELGITPDDTNSYLAFYATNIPNFEGQRVQITPDSWKHVLPMLSHLVIEKQCIV
ncbi:hypothetical protein NMY22_g10730 [Coprinellus aureogranulatus]|nr:hypothetical protein NMY22_g10730 [Coprinellus aureogranulatus]